ncbi:MAG: histidine phosphatase family protein [Paraglaciecola sp.]|nr:histidine phosphatase family protein [Paraglaciecola sp.]NCT49782.1 histidine phosphatase family protein [Paraglaciecola sp.]
MPLYLVRHGETDSNRDRIVQTPDTPLSKRGESQVQQLAQRFASQRIAAVLCSDYWRTQQTAAPLVAKQNCVLQLSPLLRERNFGDLRGRSYLEVGEDFHRPDYLPVNGESHEVFVNRVAEAWQYVLTECQRFDGQVVVITHGLVLREMVKNHLNPADPLVFAQAEFANTSVTTLDWADKKTILGLADASHLAEHTNLGGIA